MNAAPTAHQTHTHTHIYIYNYKHVRYNYKHVRMCVDVAARTDINRHVVLETLRNKGADWWLGHLVELLLQHVGLCGRPVSDSYTHTVQYSAMQYSAAQHIARGAHALQDDEVRLLLELDGHVSVWRTHIDIDIETHTDDDDGGRQQRTRQRTSS